MLLTPAFLLASSILALAPEDLAIIILYFIAVLGIGLSWPRTWIPSN